jgi:hypothetical protein
MSFATHDLPLLAFLGASLCTPVQAADFCVGVSLVCDTQTQVERFVTLLTGDAQSAVDAVNTCSIGGNFTLRVADVLNLARFAILCARTVPVHRPEQFASAA